MSQEQDKIFVDITPISEIVRQRDNLLVALTILNFVTSYLVLVGNGPADIRLIALGWLAIGASLVGWIIRTSIVAPTVIAMLNLIFAIATPATLPDFSGDTSRRNLVASLGGVAVCAAALTRPWAARRIEKTFPPLKDVFWPPVQKIKLRHSNWFRKTPLRYLFMACALAITAIILLFYRPRFLGLDYSDMSFTLGIGACVFVTFAHRYSRRTAAEILKEDTRPPVLWLRCFSDQKHFDASLGFGISAPTFEQSLSALLSEFGSSITLANPRHWMPPKSVVSDPADNDEWQMKVAEHLERAGLVIVLVGSTTDGQGFRWELTELARRQLQHRTIFIMTPHRDRTAHELWGSLAEIFQTTAFARLRDFPSEDVVLARLTLDNKLLAFVDTSRLKARSGINALAVCKAISIN